MHLQIEIFIFARETNISRREIFVSQREIMISRRETKKIYCHPNIGDMESEVFIPDMPRKMPYGRNMVQGTKALSKR